LGNQKTEPNDYYCLYSYTSPSLIRKVEQYGAQSLPCFVSYAAISLNVGKAGGSVSVQSRIIGSVEYLCPEDFIGHIVLVR
jgi:hypothetical protein